MKSFFKIKLVLIRFEKKRVTACPFFSMQLWILMPPGVDLVKPLSVPSSD